MDEKMLLQAIQQIVKTEIEPLNSRMDEMSGRMDEMSSRIDRMENRMDRIEVRMDRVEILLEHEIPKQLQLLAEGHQGIVARLPKEHEMEELHSRVSTLERVSADHSEEIRLLKYANGM
jgi:predicted  nucleic acid-binding Zn-ribbon protein